jgi:fucose permease
MALAIAASNLGVAESNPGRAAAALSLLNFSWGIGAVAFPFLVGTVLRNVPLTRLVPVLGLLPIVFAVRFARFASSGDKPTSGSSNKLSTLAPWQPLPFILVATLAFLYVGTECALGGWIASYARDFAPLSTGSAAMAPTVFWAAFLSGRALAPFFLRSYSEIAIYRLSLMTAFLGTIVFLTAHFVPLLLIGAAIAGFGLAAGRRAR